MRAASLAPGRLSSGAEVSSGPSTLGPKGFWIGFEPACLVVEVAEIVVHEADEPNPIVGLFDADGLAGKDLAEIDLLAVEADAAARGHRAVRCGTAIFQ